MLKMQETGATVREMRRWYAKEPNCQTGSKTVDPLSIEKMVGSFVWLSLGIWVTLIIFCIELVIDKKFPDVSGPGWTLMLDKLQKLGNVEALRVILTRVEKAPYFRERAGMTVREFLDLAKRCELEFRQA